MDHHPSTHPRDIRDNESQQLLLSSWVYCVRYCHSGHVRPTLSTANLLGGLLKKKEKGKRGVGLEDIYDHDESAKVRQSRLF